MILQQAKERPMFKFQLSYVNMPNNETVHLDKVFPSVITLIAYANRTYPTWTSYQIIVLRKER